MHVTASRFAKGGTSPGDIVFTTVVDEEIGGMGTLAMVDRGFQADAGIMTEPTASLSPICHGILWGRIIIDGIGGHAELLPNAWHNGGPVDAVQLIREVLDGIDMLNRRWSNDPASTIRSWSCPTRSSSPKSMRANIRPRCRGGGDHRRRPISAA